MSNQPNWDAYPPVIFGEALQADTPDGFHPRLTVIYTHAPRFLCLLEEHIATSLITTPLPIGKGRWTDPDRLDEWSSPAGFTVREFIFLDGKRPSRAELEQALDHLARAYWLWRDMYELF